MTCHTAAWALLALASLPAGHAALTAGVDAPERMVTDLRHSIFVDTAYLTRRQEEQLCTSLDGPQCIGYMAGRRSGTGLWGQRAELDGPGVIPDRMLHDLGIESGNVDFATPGYTELEGLRRQLDSEANAEHTAMLGTIDDAASLRRVRSGVEHGVMHFAHLLPDRRVPLTFSRGLPGGVVATWDGKWVVRNCLQSDVKAHDKLLPAAAAWPLALPAPDSEPGAKAHDRLLPAAAAWPLALPAPDSEPTADGGQLMEPGVRAVVELSGSLAYLRFSQPVMVRSLLARWAPKAGAPTAVVTGRLGLQGMWSTHLDPGRLQHRDWVDISGGSLQPIDEVAFLAAPGLEIGAVWIASHGSGTWDESSERTVMLLEPVPNASKTVASDIPSFVVRSRKISPAAMPFIVSLQEAVDQSLRLHAEPTSWAVPHSHGAAANYPAMLTTESTLPGMWTPVAALNQEMLEHRLLAQMLRNLPTDSKHLAAVLDHLSLALPRDLHRELDQGRQAIIDALRSWARSHGKWGFATPSTLPVNGTEAAVQRYMQAKHRQTKFDLLTVGFLHGRMRLQLQPQQPWHLQQQRQQRVDPRRA